MMSREWYLFFQGMMDPAAGGGEDDGQLLASATALVAFAEPPADHLHALAVAPDDMPDDLRATPQPADVDDPLLVPSYPSGFDANEITAALGYTPARAGDNSDITSLSGLTTPLSIAQGGTGRSSMRPVLMASRFSGYSTPFQYLARSFDTLAINTAPIDTAGAFDITTSIYTVPAGEGGLYLITGKIRLVDGVPVSVNWMVAMGAVVEDSVGASAWTSTVPNGSGTTRNVQTGTRVVSLAAGDQVRLYAYADTSGSIGVTGAELALFKL